MNLVIIGDISFEKTVIPSGSFVSVGGSGFYSSIGALAAVYRDFLLISSVGFDFDLKHLKNIGICVDGISIAANEKTAVFTSTFDDKNNRVFNSTIGALQYQDYSQITNIRNSSIVFLSGSSPIRQLNWIYQLKANNFTGMIAVDVFKDYLY